MSQEKKLVLFFAFVFLWMLGYPVSRCMGGSSRPRSPRPWPPNDAKPSCRACRDDRAKAETRRRGRQGRKPAKPRPKPAGRGTSKRGRDRAGQSSELVLGSTNDQCAGAYRIRVQLEQKGAGVDSVDSRRLQRRVRVRRSPETPPRVHQPRHQDASLDGPHPRSGRQASARSAPTRTTTPTPTRPRARRPRPKPWNRLTTSSGKSSAKMARSFAP